MSVIMTFRGFEVGKLSQKHAQLTQKLIFEATCEWIKEKPLAQVSFKDIAEKAGMSERTLYRHFSTRADFIMALADYLNDLLAAPPPPHSLEELVGYARTLYERFDEVSHIVLTILFSELYQRVFETSAKNRWVKISALVEKECPHLSKIEKEILTGNLRYNLSATTWHYFRKKFNWDLETSIAAAQLAIRATIQSKSQN